MRKIHAILAINRKSLLRTLFVAVTLCCCLTNMAAQKYVMVVEYKDGLSAEISIEENASMNFQNGTLSFADFSEEVNRIASLSFKKDSASVSACDISITINKSFISVRGQAINPGDIILSDSHARTFPANVTSLSSQDFIISLEELPTGIYIFSIKGKSIKFMKQ